MALRSIVKATAKTAIEPVKTSSVSSLYKSIVKELPRVMTIYDVDMPERIARSAIAYHFRKHANLKDEKVINILISKGYMELEETLKQWKQKTHLMRILEPLELKEKEELKADLDESFNPTYNGKSLRECFPWLGMPPHEITDYFLEKKRLQSDEIQAYKAAPGHTGNSETIFKSLPNNLQEAFLAKNYPGVKAVLESFTSEEAKTWLSICVDNGLLLPYEQFKPPRREYSRDSWSPGYVPNPEDLELYDSPKTRGPECLKSVLLLTVIHGNCFVIL